MTRSVRALALAAALALPAAAQAQVAEPVALTREKVTDVSPRFRDVERYNQLLREANADHAEAGRLRRKGIRNMVISLAFVGAGAWAASSGALETNEGEEVKQLTFAVGLGAGLPLLFLSSLSFNDWKPHAESEQRALAGARELFPERDPRGN